jgi:hypothetical protein
MDLGRQDFAAVQLTLDFSQLADKSNVVWIIIRLMLATIASASATLISCSNSAERAASLSRSF